MTAKPRVLFIDEDAASLGDMQARLQPWLADWEAAFVSATDEGHDAVLHGGHEIIVCGVDGLDGAGAGLLRLACERSVGSCVPVIAVTAAAEKALRRWALSVGAADFADKPVDPETLAARVRTVLRLREAESQLRARNEELRESEERYALAARGANDGIWDWKVDTSLAWFSARWKTILGYEKDEVTDSIDEWFDRIHPEDREEAMQSLREHLSMRSSQYRSEHRLRHRSGDWCWVRVRGQAVWDSSGHATRMAGSMGDITRSKMAEDQLVYEATHDALTGLFNRRHLMAMLNSEMHAAKRYGYSLSVCICDLDGFKAVNDTYGHTTGDEVLTAFGALVAGQLRAEDIGGRYGGDEFAVVFPHVSAEDAAIAAERVRCLLSHVWFDVPGDGQFRVSATFGLADMAHEHSEPRDLLAAADGALYAAKEAGRNCVFVEGQGMFVEDADVRT